MKCNESNETVCFICKKILLRYVLVKYIKRIKSDNKSLLGLMIKKRYWRMCEREREISKFHKVHNNPFSAFESVKFDTKSGENFWSLINTPSKRAISFPPGSKKFKHSVSQNIKCYPTCMYEKPCINIKVKGLVELSQSSWTWSNYRGYLLFWGEYQIYIIECVENISNFMSALFRYRYFIECVENISNFMSALHEWKCWYFQHMRWNILVLTEKI